MAAAKACTQLAVVAVVAGKRRTLLSWNSSKSTEKAPSIGAQHTLSIGRTVSPSTALKNVAPFACSLRGQQVEDQERCQTYAAFK